MTQEQKEQIAQRVSLIRASRIKSLRAIAGLSSRSAAKLISKYAANQPNFRTLTAVRLNELERKFTLSEVEFHFIESVLIGRARHELQRPANRRRCARMGSQDLCDSVIGFMDRIQENQLAIDVLNRLRQGLSFAVQEDSKALRAVENTFMRVSRLERRKIRA